MNIKLKCEHCGASMDAPREMAGRTSKCPACNNPVYVPTPESEIEELPLAPEDAYDLRKEAALQEERRRLDSLLAREQADGSAEESKSTRAPTAAGAADRFGGGRISPPPSGAGRMEAALSRYLTAMRDSDFEAAERAVSALKLQPRTVNELIDRMVTDPVPPPEMAGVPSGVFQGFLKTLRSKL